MGAKTLLLLAIKGFLCLALFALDIAFFILYPYWILMLFDTIFLVFVAIIFGYDLRDYQMQYNQYKMKNQFWG